MEKFIYEYNDWNSFTWDEKTIQLLLGKVRLLQGKIIGQLETFGFTLKEETNFSNLTLDVIKSSEIEGENLNQEQVRSSIAKRLGVEYNDIVHVDRDVEGIVEIMLDATQNYNSELTHERILAWHASLFPTGRSGLEKINAGEYRNKEMQIVSGPLGREKVHYIAPKPMNVKKEMDTFLNWINEENNIDGVIKSAIAHFWFIIIHPFDDGNGRIARAISDMLLARSEDNSYRYYSLSNQILNEKKEYYRTLQYVQHSEKDITTWIEWFLKCLHTALENSNSLLCNIKKKYNFWELHKTKNLNSRQRLMLNKLLEGFEGKLRTSKWAKITKCSRDTALRDIKELVEYGILKQEKSGGRSTNYTLIE